MAYRVFLSSTSKDLAAHREAVERAISGLDGFDPIVMETFGARDATATEIDAAKVRACDMLVGLVGHCYGSTPKDDPASYTEQEFGLATALGRPRLMLVASDDFRLPANLIEPEEKRQRQIAFRARVLEGRVVAMFDDPAGLAGLVTQALYHWRAEREKVDQITEELIAAKERAAELERTLAGEREALRAAVQALADKARAPDAPPKVEQALALLPEGRTAEAQAMFAEIMERRQVEGTAALQEAAAAARHLGALAYLDSTQKAIEAYTTATRLDSDDTWSWILLGRLHKRAGDLAAAEKAFQKAREVAERAGNERDVMVADNSLGDVRGARGDLPGAAAAYEAGLQTAKQLAVGDPSNMEWQRDLSVSFDWIGDVQRARGDLDAALEAYGDSAPSARSWPRRTRATPGGSATSRPASTRSATCKARGAIWTPRSRPIGTASPSPRSWPRRTRATASGSAISRSASRRSATCKAPGAIWTPRSTPIGTASPSPRSWPRRTRATADGSAI